MLTVLPPFKHISVISDINKLYPSLCQQQAVLFQMSGWHPKALKNLW